MKTTIDECLSVRNGHLFIEECDVNALAQQYGSPLFVVSENQIRRNVKRFREAFAQYWQDGPVEVLPAVKANWNLAVRAILTDAGAGADVYSEGELYSVLQTDINPEMVSVNGGGKSEGMLKRCIEAGVRITVEDLDEPEKINRIAKSLNTKAKIRIRVKPNFPNLWRLTDFAIEYASIDMGIQAYKSGVPQQYLVELGKKVLAMEHVELVGLHFHAGRHHNSLWFWKGLMKQYGKLIVTLSNAWGGYQPQEIDIGGGFASHRDPHSKLGLRQEVILTWLTFPLETGLRLLKDKTRYGIFNKIIDTFLAKLPTKARSPRVEDYARASVTTLKNELQKGGINTQGVKLQVEPGRCLFGDTGIHLTTVKKFKQQTDPIKLNWVLTDTTYFFLSGGVYEYNFHDFRVANKADQPDTMTADIVGHSCYADRILPFAKMPAVEEGDLIAFFDMGAYQEVSASNFNALPRPAMVLVNYDQSEIIKQAETIEDVYRRDKIPARLSSKRQLEIA